MAADILVVDDEPAVTASICRSLERNGHRCAPAHDLRAARRLLVDRRFDLLLCDINLPGESGLDLVREVGRDLPDTAVVMVTGIDDPAVAAEALTLGAGGYLVKPFSPNEVLIQVDGALRRRMLERAQRSHVEELEGKLLDRSASLREALRRAEEASEASAAVHREMADRLALALTLRDEETGAHVRRVGRYATLLARRAGIDEWAEDELQMAAMLHDVGKIAVPDIILLKPGELTAEEWRTVRRHPEAGFRLLEDEHSPPLRLAASVALTHHERWDGNGYPRRLAGDGIPLEGRITAIADAFDAMTSERVYQAARSFEEAADILRAGRGSQWDPGLVDCFVGGLDEAARVRAADPDREAVDGAIKVLVADDHQMYADSLCRLLDRTDGLSVLGRVGTAAEAAQRSRSSRPDVVVADWAIPGGPAGRLAEVVRAENPDIQVVVLADRPDDEVLLAAFDAGCAGCVGKQRPLEDLVDAVRAAHAGRPLVPPGQLTSLLRRLRPRRPNPVDLTRRELEILTLLGEGLSTETIAERMGVTVNTARNHIQHVLRKLDAHSRLEAVAVGVRSGLLVGR